MLLHVWPQAWFRAGYWAILVGVIGFSLPALFHLESVRRTVKERQALPALMALAVIALAIHAAVDGMALFGANGHAHPPEHGDLAPEPDDRGMVLAFAVVLHRLPLALAVWWLARPNFGRRAAIALLAGIGAATLVGYAAAGRVLVDLGSTGAALFEAGVGGMLLHVVLGGHRHDPDPARRAPPHRRLLAALGVVGALVLLLVLSVLHPVRPG